MARRPTIEVFGLSFLDMISCGLGGVLVLMLIFSARVESLAAPPAPRPSDQEVPPDLAYFHLGVRCSGGVDDAFEVRLEVPEVLRATASRFEERRNLTAGAEAELYWSLLQRGLQGQGRLEVTLGRGGGSLAAVEDLRRRACEYGFREGVSPHDQRVARQLLAVTEDLESSRTPEAWRRAMQSLYSGLEECSHGIVKAPVIAALATLDGAWDSHRSTLGPASRCRVELATHADVQALDLEVVGPRGLSVEVMGASYALVSGLDPCSPEGS